MSAAAPALPAFAVPDVGMQVVDRVAVITLRAPERRNALSGSMGREMVRLLEQIRADRAVGAVLIAAEGPVFCSGGDLNVLAQAGKDPAAASAFEELADIYQIFTTVLSLPVPVIAAVQGAVVGAGLNLVLAADLAVAADDLQIRGFGASGMHPGGGHLSLLAQKAPAAAAAVALFGETLGAEPALRAGLVWRVVPRAELMDTAMHLARRAASDPELSRMVTGTYRSAVATRLPSPAAVLLERAPQMWSLRRAALARAGDEA